MKNLKADELHPCDICKQPYGMFLYRLVIAHGIVNYQAAQRHMGLTMTLGGSDQLASVMGPDEDVVEFLQEHSLLVCQSCMLKHARRLLGA